jgi:hypothetical protein
MCKAGYTGESHCCNVIVAGLKTDLADAIATHEYTIYQAFIALVIRMDENRQRNKEQNRGNTSRGQGGTQQKDRKDCPKDNKYQLTEAERKEHFKQNLCFKCHKKGHSSSKCKGQRTVYKVVKKAPVVAIDKAKEESTPTNNTPTASSSSPNNDKGKEKQEDFTNSK